MKIVSILILMVITLTISACNKKGCKESKVKNEIGCFSVYEPVCGCNNVTYGNECEAKNAGIEMYTEGECN